jgi:hypothetical protein
MDMIRSVHHRPTLTNSLTNLNKLILRPTLTNAFSLGAVAK